MIENMTSINNGVAIRTTATARAGSSIPLRRSLSRQSSSGSLTSVNMKSGTTSPTVLDEVVRWRNKYDEAERRRKESIVEHEKSSRAHKDVEKKYHTLQFKYEELETELFEKNESLTKLTTASKNLFKEYDTLKNQYDAETGAMHRALKDASQWYRENKALKRRTLIMEGDMVDDGTDDDAINNTNELENLKDSVRQLSAEVAQLQTELSSAKLLEFETTEQNVNMTQELETERRKNEKLSAELQQIRKDNEQLIRISQFMKEELENFKQNEEQYRNDAVTLRKEANDCKRERNVLAHQSSLLLQKLTEDGPDKMMLVQEIEELKRELEEEKNKHNIEINSLQEKLEEAQHDSNLEIMEERLKLVESELEQALDRAERAETVLLAPPPPPLPPPPPAMPPPPPPPAAPLRAKKLARSTALNMSEVLGIEPYQEAGVKKVPGVGVNDDIINQIKDGKFTLRKAKKEGAKKEERDTPKAVSEMLNILGSLRRAPKNRISLSNLGEGDADGSKCSGGRTAGEVAEILARMRGRIDESDKCQ